jgi:hypothetical protein
LFEKLLMVRRKQKIVAQDEDSRIYRIKAGFPSSLDVFPILPVLSCLKLSCWGLSCSCLCVFETSKVRNRIIQAG